jgi:chemotaxis protein methyltransferase CheR
MAAGTLHRTARPVLVLEPGNEYLVETRLGPLAEVAGCASVSEFIGRVRAENRVNGMVRQVIEALTTNETLFFRDFHPFDALRKFILPTLLEQRRSARRLTIWSSAI